jgi:hypothetical protein
VAIILCVTVEEFERVVGLGYRRYGRAPGELVKPRNVRMLEVTPLHSAVVRGDEDGIRRVQASACRKRQMIGMARE